MKKIKIHTLLLLVAVSFYSCSKTDNDNSLLEPAFQRCHLSKEYIKNVLYREVIYRDNSYQVDHILYYQNNVVREDWTEYFEYENGRIASIKDDYNSTFYKYNDRGKLVSVKYCGSSVNDCCTGTYSYNATNTIPVSIAYACSDGSVSSEVFDYTNYGNLSYYYIYSEQNQSVVQLYQKFTEGYISPFEEIYPKGVDYFQDRIVEDYKARRFKEYTIDPKDVKGRYPLKMSVSTYSLPDFTQLSTDVLTYEYVGCD